MSGNDASYLLSKHSELLGLDEDDHLQYLKLVTGIKFSGRIAVGPSAGFRAVEHFPTIDEAIDYLNSLTGAEKPADEVRYVIDWHSGLYPEKPWLPDYCWLYGVSPMEQALLGDNSGEFMISIGLGGIINALVVPALANTDTGIYLRNSGSVFAHHESDYPGPGIVGTVLVTPEGQGQETITFTGQTTAADCVTEITSQGVNIEAFDRWGRLEIRSKTANKTTTIDKDGTANAGLGFSITEDTVNPTSVIDARKVDNVIIGETFGSTLDTGIKVDDRFGLTYLDRLQMILPSANETIDVTAGAIVFMSIPSLVTLGNVNLRMAENSYCEIDGGKAIGGNPDLELHDTAILKARNFTYGRRSGSGTIIPSGSRITYEFNYEGKISTGLAMDGQRRVPYDCHIENISVVRGNAGVGGQTIIDINKHNSGQAPTTLYTTQANRPTINQSDGDDWGIAPTLPDTRDLSEGQILTVDIDQAETGLSENLFVIVIATVK